MLHRPTNAADYQTVDRRVAVMGKQFAAGARTGFHSHPRAQPLYAVEGLMVVSAEAGSWVVPPGYALWIPAGLVHDVAMHGLVAMRTAYVRTDAVPDAAACRVISVSPLLRAAMVALAEEEPLLYGEGGRGGHLAAIVLDEIARAPATPFALPVPADTRLARLARHLIEDAGSPLDIDSWADRIGVSRRTLTRLFRAETGMSFGTWRRRLRLLRAAARLADGEPIGRVVASLGYRSVTAFRAMARRELGDEIELQDRQVSGVPTRTQGAFN